MPIVHIIYESLMGTAYLVFLCGRYYIVNAAGRCYGDAYLGDFVLNAFVQGESCKTLFRCQMARINEERCRTEAHTLMVCFAWYHVMVRMSRALIHIIPKFSE